MTECRGSSGDAGDAVEGSRCESRVALDVAVRKAAASPQNIQNSMRKLRKRHFYEDLGLRSGAPRRNVPGHLRKEDRVPRLI